MIHVFIVLALICFDWVIVFTIIFNERSKRSQKEIDDYNLKIKNEKHIRSSLEE